MGRDRLRRCARFRALGFESHQPVHGELKARERARILVTSLGSVVFLVFRVFDADELTVHLIEHSLGHIVHPSWRNIVRLSSDPGAHGRIGKGATALRIARFRHLSCLQPRKSAASAVEAFAVLPSSIFDFPNAASAPPA
jgi:hypothetical protein